MNNETINDTQNNVENLDITPPLVPNQNIEVYKPEPKKKKSVFGIIFSIIGILLITGALGICFYYLFIFNKNGEEVYKSVISKGYNYLDIIYNKANNYLDFKIDKPISFIGNMNLNHNNTDYLYNFECDLDYENEKMAYAQTIYKNNNELNNLIYNYENKGSYLLLKKVNNYPIKIDNKNLFEHKDYIPLNDYYYLINSFKTYLFNSFNTDDFDIIFDISKENNKYIFKKKVTFLLQNVTFDNMLSSINNNIQNDEKFMEILFKILQKKNNYPNGYNIDNAKDYLNKLTKNLIKEYDGNIGVNIYTDLLGKNIKEIEVYHEGDNLFTYKNNTFEFNLNHNEKKYNVTYSNNTIKVKDYEIKINEFTNSKINIDIIKNNKNINIILLENGNINITYNNVKININKTNKNTYEYDFISKNYKVSGKFEIKENSTFTLFDKANYIDKDNLSYNDKMNLNEEFKKLILELFSTTIPNTIMN